MWSEGEGHLCVCWMTFELDFAEQLCQIWKKWQTKHCIYYAEIITDVSIYVNPNPQNALLTSGFDSTCNPADPLCSSHAVGHATHQEGDFMSVVRWFHGVVIYVRGQGFSHSIISNRLFNLRRPRDRSDQVATL